ncbi:MAG: tetratricopeptide repeat protein [Deltaproteobacteria bacterium]|nr:tetratricopeptide repeat protein [Deltaproteobacteria bacterium]
MNLPAPDSKKERFGHLRTLSAFLFLLALITLVYGNTFSASWHFDDHPNIRLNPRVHIRDLSPDTLMKVFSEGFGGEESLYRPVSCLSFSLNWICSGDRPAAYHMTNTLVHFLTGFILFLTLQALLRSPRLNRRFEGKESIIALLAATLWALHPIQTEAVTYIVQRMASLAALFYVLGIYLYVRSRISSSRVLSAVGFSTVLLLFALAIGSKENAATLPAALVLIEACFFQDLEHPKTRRVLIGIAAGIVVLSMITGAFLFRQSHLFAFLDDYSRRPFTLSERLMTEPRVVLFYLSQILLPLPSRLSVQHDITLSTSLLEPWSTAPAMAAVLLLLGLGFSQIEKRPVLSFSVLFYFLNHLMESTVAPLELVFEHRNYLPSLFLFLPLSAWVQERMARLSGRGRLLWIPVSLIVLTITALAAATFERNEAWQDEKSLWKDALLKAPGSSRPYHNLAVQYHLEGSYEEALTLYREAARKKNLHSIYGKSATYLYMSYIYAERGEIGKAATMAQEALRIDPDSWRARLELSLLLTRSGRKEDAARHLRELFSQIQNPAHGRRRPPEVLDETNVRSLWHSR